MRSALALLLALGLAAPHAGAYPIDGRKRTGIRRLDGYRKAEEDPRGKGPRLPPGALLGEDEVALALARKNESWDLEDAGRDPALQKALEQMLRDRDPSYAIAVVDVTDPEHIAWAGVRETREYVPQSVGKILVATGLLDALRRAFPALEDRERILRETVVEATAWAMPNSHRVPHFDEKTGTNRFAPVSLGDRFTLSEWLDHALSSSSNAAGSTIWKEAMLLRRFGAEYPVSREREEEFFRSTPRSELARLGLAVIEEPLVAAGLDTSALRQGTFYTRGGQARVPGSGSTASPRELVRFLVRLEQGRVVDPWSSRELKRYLYMTRKRYRYAYAPELAGAAVFFKSGSHYRCAAEEGFRCGKYRGNVENLMNSVAIVETPARGEKRRRYLVALMSNVLRRNSAWDHSRIAAAVDEALRTREAVPIEEKGSAAEVHSSGQGD